MKEQGIFVFWYEFLDWLLDKTEKFPKKSRFTIVSRIDNLGLDIMEGLVIASYSGRDKKIRILKDINIKLERLRVLLRLSSKRKFINLTSFEYAMRKVDECGKMVGGWIKERERQQ